MLATKHLIVISGVLLCAILSFGYFHKEEPRQNIRWDERSLTWDDFPEAKYITGNFDAEVYSDITYAWNKDEENLSVYSFMNPNRSKKKHDEDTIGSKQLLIHEQYHFNITEYCARLFRKEVVSIGLKNLTSTTLERLDKKYSRMTDSLQIRYDTESRHNIEDDKQRYWELHIDALLRNTAYYEDENLYNYYNFTKDTTQWYRQIHKTVTGTMLFSMPTSAEHGKNGKVYHVKKTEDSIVISFYKNEELHNDPYFETPIIVLTYPEKNVTKLQFFDKEMRLNHKLPFCQTEIEQLSDGTVTTTFYDAQNAPALDNLAHKIMRTYNKAQNSYFATYYNQNNLPIINGDNIYHEERFVDSLGRAKSIAYYNKAKKPILDKEFIHKYVYTLNDDHMIIGSKYYDVDKTFAFYLDEFNCKMQYDERGNLTEFEVLDHFSNRSANKSGISKYTYVFDKYDQLTDIYRYNHREMPVLGLEEYYHQVTLYKKNGDPLFYASYYPGYVLHFSDQRRGASKYVYDEENNYTIVNVDAYNYAFEDDSGIGKIKKIRDENNNIIREEYYDTKDIWAKTTNDVVIYTYAYDANKNLIETRSFNWANQPIATTTDVATTKWTYDTRGNKVETAYYTAEGTIASDENNVSYNLYKYNKNNVLIEQSNLNKNRKPQEVDGVYKTRFTINRFGKDSISEKLNAANERIKATPITKYLYNTYGELTSERYYDPYGRPTIDGTGVHKTVLKFDKFGRNTGYKNYGIQGKLTNDIFGVAQETKTLTKSGFLNTLSYFNKNDEKVAGVEGYHSLRYIWNDYDEIVRVTTFDISGNMWNNEAGVADFVYQKSPSSMATRYSLYDKNNELVEDEEGVAEYIYETSLNGLYYPEKKLNAAGVDISNTEFNFDIDESLESALDEAWEID